MYIKVLIYDDFNGMTVYDIPDAINMTSDAAVTSNLLNQLTSGGTDSAVMKSLTTGTLNECAKNVIALALTLNSLVYDDDSSNPSSNTDTSTTTKATIGGTTTPSKQQEARRNAAADGRENLLNVIAKLPMSSLASLNLFASMISVTTRKNDEINTKAAVNKKYEQYYLFFIVEYSISFIQIEINNI